MPDYKLTTHLSKAVIPTSIVVVGIVMAYLSWEKWPDILVDFGIELYVPWQLSEGHVLYKDIAYFYGPLSPYWNSLLFHLFGVSISVLIGFNILVIIALAYLIYRFFSVVCGSLTATLSCITFLTTFAFAQFVFTGNYNFVTPYAHQLTHGILLSFLAIYLLKVYLKSHRMVWMHGMGLLLGLIFLTKIEVFLSVFLAMLAGFLLIYWIERPPKISIIKFLGLFGTGLVLPMAVFLIYLSFHMKVGQALRVLITPWFSLIKTRVASIQFFRNLMGINSLGTNLKKMLILTGCYLLLAVLLGSINHILRKFGKNRNSVSIVAFLISIGFLFYFSDKIPWLEIFRPLPLIMLVFAIYLLSTLIHDRKNSKTIVYIVPIISMTVFAFLLMLKMILNVHVYHYGFSLVMPATILFVTIVMFWLPKFFEKISGYAGLFRAVSFAVIVAILMSHFIITTKLYSMKTQTVRSGPDTIKTYHPKIDRRGIVVEVALDVIGKVIKQEESFVVLPEGVMLNYLSRRKTPIPYINFMPTELAIFGEQQILQSLKDAYPPYVFFVHKDTSEYGYRFFGQDYGQKIYSWVNENYIPFLQIGAIPFRSNEFGILLMKRSIGGAPLGLDK